MRDTDANLRQDVDYQFTFTGSQVTGMQAVVGSQTYDLSLPTGAHFNVGASTVMETLVTSDSVTLTVYAKEAGSTLYYKGDVSTTFTNPSAAHDGYSFTLDSSGAVTAMQRVETEHHGTETENVHIPLDAVFSTSTGMVTEQSVRGNEVDTITYTKPSGSTLYAVESIEKTYIDPGTATTSLNVDADSRMEFTFDASGNVTKAQTLDLDGALNTVSNPHVAFTQLAPGYVEEVTTHGPNTSYAVFYEGQASNGVYTEVAHGSGSAVDLAGLQGQVHQAEQVLMTGGASTSATGWII